MSAHAYMTDEEAAQQTCPFIRFCVNEEAVSQHQVHPIYIHQSCQGSRCRIAWRSRGDGKGYCGMAGRPTGWEGEQNA